MYSRHFLKFITKRRLANSGSLKSLQLLSVPRRLFSKPSDTLDQKPAERREAVHGDKGLAYESEPFKNESQQSTNKASSPKSERQLYEELNNIAKESSNAQADGARQTGSGYESTNTKESSKGKKVDPPKKYHRFIYLFSLLLGVYQYYEFKKVWKVYRDFKGWLNNHPFDLHDVLFKMDESKDKGNLFLIVNDSLAGEATQLSQELRTKLLECIDSLGHLHFQSTAYGILGLYISALIYQVSNIYSDPKTEFSDF